jgi:phytoene dehydrogenase-like protein
MARTPLMRALQQLAREHGATARVGIPVEELRERELEARLSRREFLRRTGAVGAVVAVAGPAAVARLARAAAASRIAIVGGGIAGLAAALRL